jgi:hypothetical protein
MRIPDSKKKKRATPKPSKYSTQGMAMAEAKKKAALKKRMTGRKGQSLYPGIF